MDAGSPHIYRAPEKTRLHAGGAAWKRLSPLALFWTLQALLLFRRLDRLSPRFDEADTLIFMRGPLREAMEIPASGLHRPLYCLLLWRSMRLVLLGTARAASLERAVELGGKMRVTPYPYEPFSPLELRLMHA